MLRLLEAVGINPQSLPCAGQWPKGSSWHHSPWCPMPSFQQGPVFSTSPVSSKGWLDPAAAGAQGWGLLSSGERAGAGWSSRLPDGAPGYQNRQVGTVTAKGVSAGSEADLLVMLGISSHHLPACSSFPWCFPPPSPSGLSVDFPAALPQHFPSISQLQALQRSSRSAFPSPPCSLPSHSQLPGWSPRLSIPLFSRASPYAPRSLQRLCPSTRLHLRSISVPGRQQPPAECPNGAPPAPTPVGSTDTGDNTETSTPTPAKGPWG